MSEAPVTSGATRVIRATPQATWTAFVDPRLLVQWLPPAEMTGEIHAFDARAGGGYRMSLYYPDSDGAGHGKTSDGEDRVEVRFVEMQPPERIVELSLEKLTRLLERDAGDAA